MAYDPGALDAALAAAVGDEPGLIAELRHAFFSSADAHVAALKSATSLADWQAAAQRLKGLAASFGARRLMDAASELIARAQIDPADLRKIERVLAALAA